MKKSTLKKLGIGIGIFAGGLSTIIMYFEGELTKAFTYLGFPLGLGLIILLWAVGIGFSMLIAKHLSYMIGIEDDESITG